MAMPPQKSYASSLPQCREMLLTKFVSYFQKTSHFYIQLQNYKRQLASFLNSINYTPPFAALDLDRKGKITQQNLQNFLIKYRYFVKPADINRYFQKYLHGKNVLEYEDILESLVPHSDYILMASTAKTINDTLLNRESSKYFCKRVDNEILKNMVALIISNEISYMKAAFIMIDDLTNDSLKVGPLLWGHIDRNHDNHLDFQRMAQIAKQTGAVITEQQWTAFINWHFRSHKHSLTRDDFMVIFDNLITNKRNKSACNYENFAQRQIYRKLSQSLREKRAMETSIAAKRVAKVGEQHFQQSAKSAKTTKTGFEQFDSPKTTKRTHSNFGIDIDQNILQTKRLLYTKLGYKTPQNLIKYAQLT